jgi:hypothetical protein
MNEILNDEDFKEVVIDFLKSEKEEKKTHQIV